MSKTLTAGHRLKDWVLVQHLDKEPKDYEDIPAEWETVWHGRCKIMPARAAERVVSVRIEEHISHAVIFRWNPELALKSSHRIIVDDQSIDASQDHTDRPLRRVLEIDGVFDIDERSKFRLVTCTEVTS